MNPFQIPGAAPKNLTRLRDRLLWLCPLVGLIAGTVILYLFSFTLWTAVSIVFLITCPLVGVWVLVIERRQNPNARRKL